MDSAFTFFILVFVAITLAWSAYIKYTDDKETRR